MGAVVKTVMVAINQKFQRSVITFVTTEIDTMAGNFTQRGANGQLFAQLNPVIGAECV